MKFSSDYQGREREIDAVFEHSFRTSEGAEEGARISALASALMASVTPEDLYVFLASDEGHVTGSIIFTRLTFEDPDRTVFLLSPVAIAPDQQGEGVGKELLRYGLGMLQQDGVDIAVTYGDPNYYSRVGFSPVSQGLVPPPQPLQQPHGWLAQSLTDAPLTPLRGPCRCVEAFNDPSLW